VQDVPENLVLKSTWHGHPSIIVTPQEKNMVEIHNNSLLPATIFPNLPIVEAEIKIHKVNAEMEVEKKSSENFWPNENIDEDRLEAILEPGLEIMEPKIMSKELSTALLFSFMALYHSAFIFFHSAFVFFQSAFIQFSSASKCLFFIQNASQRLFFILSTQFLDHISSLFFGLF
jgi:hypothetical protein